MLEVPRSIALMLAGNSGSLTGGNLFVQQRYGGIRTDPLTRATLPIVEHCHTITVTALAEDRWSL
jgi:hypothetical protein